MTLGSRAKYALLEHLGTPCLPLSPNHEGTTAVSADSIRGRGRHVVTG